MLRLGGEPLRHRGGWRPAGAWTCGVPAASPSSAGSMCSAAMAACEAARFPPAGQPAKMHCNRRANRSKGQPAPRPVPEGKRPWPTAGSDTAHRTPCLGRGGAGDACLRPAGQAGDPHHQAADHRARPVAGLFAGRRRALPAHPRAIPALAYDYTTKGNMVAVISNGTAVLGLGNLGALASQAGDGRQGRAVQALRRRRRHRPRSRHRGRRRVRQLRALSSAPASAASTWRTSRRRNASSSSSACAS